MTKPIRFRFRHADAEGKPMRGRVEKGVFDGRELSLADTTIPGEKIVCAQRVKNTIVLEVDADGGVRALRFQVPRSLAAKLYLAIARQSSRRRAEFQQQACRQAGCASVFRSEICPLCECTIDLTDLPPTPGVYCPYCQTLQTVQGIPPAREERYRICGECGLFARARTVMEPYLFLWFISARPRRMCSACMRGAAWRTFLADLFMPVLLPSAIWDLWQAYLGGRGGSFAGLVHANVLARRRRTEQALARYDEILQRLGPHAGLYYNRGMARILAHQTEAAISEFQAALDACANYRPAQDQLAACRAALEANGMQPPPAGE